MVHWDVFASHQLLTAQVQLGGSRRTQRTRNCDTGPCFTQVFFVFSWSRSNKSKTTGGRKDRPHPCIRGQAYRAWNKSGIFISRSMRVILVDYSIFACFFTRVTRNGRRERKGRGGATRGWVSYYCITYIMMFALCCQYEDGTCNAHAGQITNPHLMIFT